MWEKANLILCFLSGILVGITMTVLLMRVSDLNHIKQGHIPIADKHYGIMWVPEVKK